MGRIYQVKGDYEGYLFLDIDGVMLGKIIKTNAWDRYKITVKSNHILFVEKYEEEIPAKATRVQLLDDAPEHLKYSAGATFYFGDNTIVLDRDVSFKEVARGIRQVAPQYKYYRHEYRGVRCYKEDGTR